MEQTKDFAEQIGLKDIVVFYNFRIANLYEDKVKAKPYALKCL